MGPRAPCPNAIEHYLSRDGYHKEKSAPKPPGVNSGTKMEPPKKGMASRECAFISVFLFLSKKTFFAHQKKTATQKSKPLFFCLLRVAYFQQKLSAGISIKYFTVKNNKSDLFTRRPPTRAFNSFPFHPSASLGERVRNSEQSVSAYA